MKSYDNDFQSDSEIIRFESVKSLNSNDQIELKICIDTYFHLRNAIVMSEFIYFDILTF